VAARALAQVVFDQRPPFGAALACEPLIEPEVGDAGAGIF
jgi:hypothetical protein